MSLNESILKDAALESFGVLVYAAGQEPLLASGEPAAEGDSFSDVVLVGRLRQCIGRLNSTIPLRALPTLHGMLLLKLLSGELNVS
ncbi:hypothetical protein [Synechococcus sp. 1G10]|uniref:hypothetical protein n=1 Tax=Synechococcus sp. 1G10 TaxID=2025605 RepID=UPI000B98F9A2|nr:hypothetical protein [Synechococcus sp. 1G10]